MNVSDQCPGEGSGGGVLGRGQGAVSPPLWKCFDYLKRTRCKMVQYSTNFEEVLFFLMPYFGSISSKVWGRNTGSAPPFRVRGDRLPSPFPTLMFLIILNHAAHSFAKE